MSIKDTTNYDVQIVGKLWQPGIVAANHITVERPLPAFRMTDGESDEEYETRMVQCATEQQLGDFSEITGWDIRKVHRIERQDFISAEEDGFRVEDTWIQRHVEFTQLVSFTDEQEEAYMNCFSGGED